MSEREQQEKAQEPVAQAAASLRFEEFADAASAQAAFDAAYPVGSPIERALQALSAMGAQGKTVNPTIAACRYLEDDVPLARRCWYIVLVCSNAKAIERVSIALEILAI